MKLLLIGFLAALGVGLCQIIISAVAEELFPNLHRFWTSTRGEGFRFGVLSVAALGLSVALLIAGLQASTTPDRQGFLIFAGLLLVGTTVAVIAAVRRFRSARS